MADPSGFNNPRLGQAFNNIASAFAPPSAQDIYAYSRAAEARQKTQRAADLWRQAQDPNFNKEVFDRSNVAAGNYAPSGSYYGVDKGDATKRYGIGVESGDRRRGQDLESSDRRRGQDLDDGTKRYGIDTTAKTAITTTGMKEEGDTKRAVIAPLNEGQIQYLPPSVASLYGVPETRGGIVKLNQGQKAVVPGGGEIQGNAKPLNETELKAKILETLPPEIQAGVAAKDLDIKDVIVDGKTVPMTKPQQLAAGVPSAAAPAATGQYFRYTVPGGASGTAMHDPVRNVPVDAQTKQPLPSNAKLESTSNGTTVNVGPNGEPYGAPPANMAWARNPDNSIKLDDRGAPVAVAIQGTPLYNKEKDAAAKQAAGTASRQTSGNIVTQDIDRAIQAIQTDPTLTTGVGAQVTSGIGGTPARNAKALIDTVKANIGFDRLSEMRAASPTGGALGNVTVKEIEFLQAVLGNLDQAQSPEQLIENLKRVKDATLDVVHGKGQGPARAGERVAVNRQTGERILVDLGGNMRPYNE